MKIAQVAPPWITIPPKNYGGTESVICNLIEAQVAQGHDVTLFAPGDAKTSAKHVSFFPKSLLTEGVPWTMHLKAFYHLQKALEQVREQDFDIVHMHLSSGSDMYILPLAATFPLPHVTTLHSHFPFDHGPGGWTGDADKYYMDWASQVPIVAISKTAKAQEKMPLNFAGVVYNGIDMEQVRPGRRKPGDYFVWLGRFVPEKGPHLAIEAAKRANVPLVLAGTIDRYEKASMTYFQEQVKPHFDKKQIRYVGPVNMKEKVSLLSRARGFLNPIEWEEPFGMVMVEALAVGCPVISFERGAAPEIIEHGKTGFLVHNLDELIEHIPRIAEIDRGTLRPYVDQRFSARVMAENYMQVYEQVIQSRRQAQPQAATDSVAVSSL
ncbi:glycosyltransferase family 4 protein [Ktedonosporobacter rubrisoli]|uniref:Glycosyltransferase family 4 protein n=1 Tax=Ktedonosporobacter rubrisoli TaxID=2509675 RepID=A0A4P6JW38_KTERU|nr:glycosyltransferase family 4 protein [Ktedonosporobacter rubrisoli]QBD79898.1 glycosyltransferase family 4 protein [Ktedonosporobacter rubrisoli]